MPQNYDFVVEPLTKPAIIASDVVSDNCVQIIFKESYEKNNFYDNVLPAVVVGQAPELKQGQECLVIKEHSGGNSIIYFLGVIGDSKTEEVKTNRPKEKVKNGISSKNNNASLQVNDGEINLNTPKGKFVLNDTQYETETSTNKLLLNKNTSAMMLFDAGEDDVLGSLLMGKRKTTLFTKKLLSFQAKNTHTETTGNFIITGGYNETKKGKEGDFAEYDSANLFYFKGRNANFDVNGGGFNVNGNIFKVDLGSSRFGSFIPGTGPAIAYDVTILNGDTSFSTSTGSFYVDLFNGLFMDEIKLTCGSPIHPTQSNLTLEAFSSKLELQTVFTGINSYLEFSTGGFAELYSFLNIDIESMTGNINLSSLQNTSIDATMNINLSSVLDTNIDAIMNINMNSKMETNIDSIMDININSKMNTNIESIIETAINGLSVAIEAKVDMTLTAAVLSLDGQILDLSGSGMIKAGPKTAAPTGAGPFCAIPICPFTGLQHVGDTAV